MRESERVLAGLIELVGPPRPGLIPESGDPEHPYRWVRPDSELDAPTSQPIVDLRKELVGRVERVQGFWPSRDFSNVMEQAGFEHVGNKLADWEDEDTNWQNGHVQVWMHPIFGRLENHLSEPTGPKGGTSDQFSHTETIKNPNADFKPELRDPTTLSIRERMIGRQDYIERFMSSEASRRFKTAAEKSDITVPELKKQIREAIQPLVDAADVWVRVPPHRLKGILTAGRFMPVAETQKMGSGKAAKLSEYLPHRDSAEQSMFNIPPGEMHSERPIYGYLSDHADGHGKELGYQEGQQLDAYGTVAVRLKSSVRERTTMTIGDTLDINSQSIAPRILPSMLDNVQAEAVLGDLFDPKKKRKSILDADSYYVEAQIHGVVIDDIAEVVFYESPSSSITNQLKRLGVSHRAAERQVYNPKDDR